MVEITPGAALTETAVNPLADILMDAEAIAPTFKVIRCTNTFSRRITSTALLRF